MMDRLTGGLTLAIAVAAAGWVALGAADATWHGAGIVRGTTAPPPAPQRTATPEPPPDLGPVLARHLFGAPPPPEAPLDVEPEQTALDLVLHGVVLAADAAVSTAYISQNRKPAEGYAPGDPITDRARIKAIRADEVLLDVDGRIEILGFPDPDAKPKTSDVRANILAATGRANLPAPGSTPDQAIEFWRQRIAKNPQAVLDQLGLEATDEGYVIGQRTHAGVRRAGFRPGDVVARVNGSDVGNVEADRRLYDEIAASGRARVEILRGGKPIVLTFPLR